MKEVDKVFAYLGGQGSDGGQSDLKDAVSCFSFGTANFALLLLS